MITIPDREVDETYSRGIAALAEHARGHTARARHRSRRFVPAIVGLGVPLAALAAAVVVVIVDHANPAPAPNLPPTAGNVTLVLGQTFRVTDSQGLVASVTVWKAPMDFDTQGIGLSAPANGVYVGVKVLLTLPAAIDNSVASSKEFSDEQATLDSQQAVLTTLRIDGDVVRARAEELTIARTQAELSQLARQLLPFTFTYVATDGQTYPAFNGNALQSGFAPFLIPTTPLPKGLTYGDIAFDVPSAGGIIQMTNPFNSAVATWRSS